MKRRVLIFLLMAGLVVGSTSAQLGSGIVYDPTNYQNALLRYYQLRQHLLQLEKTYAQVVTQYNLALRMAQSIQNMPARYRALFSQWRNGSALNTFGNTSSWITGVNTGTSAEAIRSRPPNSHRTIPATFPLWIPSNFRASSRNTRRFSSQMERTKRPWLLSAPFAEAHRGSKPK